MFRNKIVFLLLGVLLCFSAAPLYARQAKAKTGKTKFSRRFQQKWGRHPVTVRQQIFNSNVKGSFPSRKTTERCAKRFFQTLEYLPESFIRKTGLKYVTFLHNLKLNGKDAAGVASGNTIFLSADFSTKTVFHELFHIFDPIRYNKVWCGFNDKKFIYTGSSFYSVKVTKQERKQIKKNRRDDDITDGFVSKYAMSFEWEDRAETFAYMLVEGRRFLKRAKNPVIHNKMEYIIDMFIQRNLLPQDFWDKHFDSKFKLRNRFYTNEKK